MYKAAKMGTGLNNSHYIIFSIAVIISDQPDVYITLMKTVYSSHSIQEADLSNFMTFVFFIYIPHKYEWKTTADIKALHDDIH